MVARNIVFQNIVSYWCVFESSVDVLNVAEAMLHSITEHWVTSKIQTIISNYRVNLVILVQRDPMGLLGHEEKW